MTVFLRIFLYAFAGWLYGSGYIGDEIKHILTNDPAIVAGLEAGISAAVLSMGLIWRKVAKRFGWST